MSFLRMEAWSLSERRTLQTGKPVDIALVYEYSLCMDGAEWADCRIIVSDEQGVISSGPYAWDSVRTKALKLLLQAESREEVFEEVADSIVRKLNGVYIDDSEPEKAPFGEPMQW